jgi:hypothetical protein
MFNTFWRSNMFPVYNGECSFVEYPQYKTEQDLRNCAKVKLNKQTMSIIEGKEAAWGGMDNDN